MPVTKTQTTFASPFTQSTLGDEIKARYVAAGFTLVDDYISGTDRFVVVSAVFDASKNFGTVFLRCRIAANLGITQTLGTGYNASTKAMTSESIASTSTVFASTVPIDFINYKRETFVNLLQLVQGTSTICFLGFVRPAHKPVWWDENQFLYAFQAQNTVNSWFANILGSTSTPFIATSTGHTLRTPESTQLSSASPTTGKRDIVPGLVYFSLSNQGVGARLSDDFVLVAGTSLSRLDVLQVSATEEYTLFYAGSSSIAVRTL